jgi:hypothetical protein
MPRVTSASAVPGSRRRSAHREEESGDTHQRDTGDEQQDLHARATGPRGRRGLPGLERAGLEGARLERRHIGARRGVWLLGRCGEDRLRAVLRAVL